MKKHQSLITMVACSLAALAPGAFAQDDGRGFYAGGDLGGTLTQSTELKEFFGPVTPGTRINFDPGIRMGIDGGYHVTDWLGLEGQTGIMGSKIASIDGASYLHNAWLDNVPLMAGVRLELPKAWRKFGLSPYIGGGAGGSVSLLDADHLNIGGTAFHGTDGEVVFAYQAFGGVRYALNEHMDIGVEYHYFATSNEDWRNSTFGTTTDRIRLAGIDLHAFSVAFQYHF